MNKIKFFVISLFLILSCVKSAFFQYDRCDDRWGKQLSPSEKPTDICTKPRDLGMEIDGPFVTVLASGLSSLKIKINGQFVDPGSLSELIRRKGEMGAYDELNLQFFERSKDFKKEQIGKYLDDGYIVVGVLDRSLNDTFVAVEVVGNERYYLITSDGNYGGFTIDQIQDGFLMYKLKSNFLE